MTRRRPAAASPARGALQGQPARRATYRLQLSGAFGLAHAAGLVDYLADLGVSHVYTSPYLAATPGSCHGYDVVAHDRVNPELGGESGRAIFVTALRRRGLGHLLDIVPNHMAVAPENAWWWDVLENGPSSAYAAYFDVDWTPPETRLHHRILLPVLTDQYGRVLEAGEIRLVRDHAVVTVRRYHEHAWPVEPRSLASLCAAAAERARSAELASLADALHGLPSPTAVVVGAWPLSPERGVAYMEKAAREARADTTWTAPSARYETALRTFVEGAMGDASFQKAVAAFVEPLIEPGRITGLAQTLLKLTVPGVPDLYQGTELWSLDLVDPDNRRSVDYAERRRLLASLSDAATPEWIWARIDIGLPKLWVVRQALRLRCRHEKAFGIEGVYEPLQAGGAKEAHVVAFVRGDMVVTVVPRLVLGVAGEWADTRLSLPSGRWRNQLTGELEHDDVELSRLLRRFPVALLVREGLPDGA